MQNQPQINSIDQFYWRKEKEKIHNKIRLFCSDNNIKFTHRCNDKLIKNSQETIIVHMWLFEAIPTYDYWQQLNLVCQQQGKMLLVVTDNLFEFYNLDFVKFFSYPKLLGVFAPYDNILFDNYNPNKLYNCFIQRVDSTRQSWFYFLHQHGLLDKGYVSCLMYQLSSYSNLTGVELFDYIHQQYQLGQLPHFQKSYTELRDSIPYQNFIESNNQVQMILDSKYSLVLETYAVEDHTNRWVFSEKTMRALQFPPISLLFVQLGGIEKLKLIGLQTNQILDHIDKLSWQQRQQEFLKILIEDSVDLDFDLMYNQAMHNKNLLQTWKAEYQKSDFFEDFFNQALSL